MSQSPPVAHNASTPFDMVVVGGTGDLAHRKLLPALYYLHRHGDLPPEGRIIAVAREERSREQYIAELEISCREHVEAEDFTPEDWARFAERLHYLAVDAADADGLQDLRKMLEQASGDLSSRTRVFYLATPPHLYGPISRAVQEAGLVTATSRMVLEKPIGHDLDSATAINAAVGEVFEETQIYRIDHYLGKETVQNLISLRFANALFEPMWNSNHIDNVQITVAETLGVEGRGSYYDDAGALRDMVQNHMLQLLCLTAMEPPSRLEQDFIRQEKIKVLRALRPMSREDIPRKTVRGQYREGVVAGKTVQGYLEEEDIPSDSKTETFVALKAEVDNWRWAGVPFYLRTGKSMGHRVSEIVIQFKTVPHNLFGSEVGALHDNRLVIRLQPDESIKLALMVKKPGIRLLLKRVHLNLNLADTFEGRTPRAYERLLLDVLRGNATLFMHRDEVQAAWRWIEPILDGWEERGDAPRIYAAGSWGPAESITLVLRDERNWYEQVV